MALTIRAIYQSGQLRLLDPVELDEGQQVEVTIRSVDDDEALRLVLGDLVRWPDPSDNRHPEVEAEAEAIDKAFSAGRLVSEYIIEDRGEV